MIIGDPDTIRLEVTDTSESPGCGMIVVLYAVRNLKLQQLAGEHVLREDNWLDKLEDNCSLAYIIISY